MRNGLPVLNPGVDLKGLQLSPAESYVLSRVDGRTTIEQLVVVTRLPQPRLEEILARFVRDGVVVLEAAAAAVDDPGDGTHRKLFESRLRAFDEDARVALAGTCNEPELSALCFDPLPQVVRKLLENPRFGPSHARLVADHHRDPRGLEALVHRAELFRDAHVQRLLLRNPQLPEALLKRMLTAKRMLEIFKVAISREVGERAKRSAMTVLRQRFATGAAEERVELILQTEGRALAGLAGIPVDGKTAALLCARTMHSTILIQNIARWAAAPPPLIAHLLKSPLVRRQPQLRSALQRHPNAPSDATR